MAADFFFINPTFTIQSLKPVAVFKWQRLGNPEVQYAIAAEEQYLNFHLYMLNNLRHTQAGHIAQPPYVYELGLSVRAGAVKAAVLIAASIVEAALRALAEARGYTLNADPRRRTFGNVIRAWEQNDVPRNEVAAIWRPYQAMKEIWKTSKNPTAWEGEERGAILPWWWFFFLVAGMLGNASFRTSMSANEIHELITATGITIASDLLSIPATIIALVLVGKIYEMQMSHVVRRI